MKSYSWKNTLVKILIPFSKPPTIHKESFIITKAGEIDGISISTKGFQLFSNEL